MKKFKAALAAVLVTALFTACGNADISQHEGQIPSSPEASAAGEQNSDAEAGGLSQQESGFIPVSGAMSSEDAAQKLLVFVNDGDRLAACAIDKVPDASVTRNNAVYLKTDSSTFKSAADIENYFSAYFSADKVSSMALTSGDYPTYTDIDGELYVLDSGRGCGYNWSRKNGRIETIIADETGDSFTIYAPFDMFGTEERAEVRVVKENGCWKIDSYGMNDPSVNSADEDVFSGKWSAERTNMDIQKNADSSYSVIITGSLNAFQKASWNYTCYYNPAAGTLDSVTGNKETVTFSERGTVESSNIEGGQSASFRSEADGIQWVDNTAAGNSHRFVRAEAE